VVRKADGYYTQFCVDVERIIKHEYTGEVVGIDLGLEFFLTDSDGGTVQNPRKLKKSEKRLKRLQRKVSSKKKGSVNRKRAINKMARQHLKVSRQRKDFAVHTAGALVASHDLIAYENLQVQNMVKNQTIAKSISDASWSMFVRWVEYYARLHKIVTVAVPPQYTSTDCSGCGERVKKTLSQRTHQCLKCGLKINRDHNAAKNILVKGLEVLGIKQSTDGQSGTNAFGENHLWSVEGNVGWLSGLDDKGNPRGNSLESPTIITSAMREVI
jgi:putative transposase